VVKDEPTPFVNRKADRLPEAKATKDEMKEYIPEPLAL